jgi:hypothetical protein
VTALLALAACGSGNDIPSPLEREERERQRASAASEAYAVTLSGSGIATSALRLPFSTDRELVEATLDAVLGEPDRELAQECGAGTLAVTTYPEGLRLNFQNGAFVGWFYDGTGMTAALPRGSRPGTPIADLENRGGFTFIDSTLPGEFALGEAIGGFAEDDKVSALYAGTNCFMR